MAMIPFPKCVIQYGVMGEGGSVPNSATASLSPASSFLSVATRMPLPDFGCHQRKLGGACERKVQRRTISRQSDRYLPPYGCMLACSEKYSVVTKERTDSETENNWIRELPRSDRKNKPVPWSTRPVAIPLNGNPFFFDPFSPAPGNLCALSSLHWFGPVEVCCC